MIINILPFSHGRIIFLWEKNRVGLITFSHSPMRPYRGMGWENIKPRKKRPMYGKEKNAPKRPRGRIIWGY